MPELRRWQIISNGRHEFALGNVYNDPGIADGTYIRTARIIEHHDTVIRTNAKSYQLIGDGA